MQEIGYFTSLIFILLYEKGYCEEKEGYDILKSIISILQKYEIS